MRPKLTILLLTLALEAHAIDVISHRGNACGEVENSHGAIRTSWSIGSDAIELDVRVSKDDVAYLFHDDEINNVAVTDLSYAEIQRHVGQVAAPTLISALKSVEPSGYYVLDLKDASDEHYWAIIEAVRESQIAQHRLTFQSENVATLSTLKQEMPKSRYFFLPRLKRRLPFFRAPSPKKLLNEMTSRKIEGVSLKGRRFISREFVEILQVGGLQVHVWTINDVARARYYKNIGVDGLITDKAEELLEEFGKRSPGNAKCWVRTNAAESTMAAPNKRMQRTCQNVTAFAFAKAAPFRHAADPWC